MGQPLYGLTALATVPLLTFIVLAVTVPLAIGAFPSFAGLAPILAKPLCVLSMGVLAIALQTLKARHRDYYGAMELGFAAFAAWKALGGWNNEIRLAAVESLSLVGATYLMARGIENFLQGRGMKVGSLFGRTQKTPSQPGA